MLANLVALCVASSAHGVIGTPDRVPAATLLFPYFEVDLSETATSFTASHDTVLTLFTFDARAVLTHVTLWTSDGVPVFGFHVYLTGHDVEQLDLFEVLRGTIPRTAPAQLDLSDLVSPHGPQSQDLSYSSCVAADFEAPPDLAAEMRAAFLGTELPGMPGVCASRAAPDEVARGYVTVDVMSECTDLFPGDPGYFGPLGAAGDDNRIFGSFAIFDDANETGHGEAAIHIEADPDDPMTTTAGQPTFYGRFSGWDASDHREPLPTRWATPYDAFGRDALIVWRDPQVARGPFACDAPPPPLPAQLVLAFDMASFFTTLDGATVFGRVLDRVSLDALAIPYARGWLRLDLRHGTNGPSSATDYAQSVVLALRGVVQCGVTSRFGGAMQAIPLDVPGTYSEIVDEVLF